MLRWWYIECVALGALWPLQNSYSNLVMDHLQNHCKDSLLILSLCQHQKLAGYFCLGRCTFCCKGLFILCLPCSQVMFSTIMQKEIFDSLYYRVFFLDKDMGKKRGTSVWCNYRCIVAVSGFPDVLIWALPASSSEAFMWILWVTLWVHVIKKRTRGRRFGGEALCCLLRIVNADCLKKITLGSWELALELTEGGREKFKKLISISFEAMLKCLQGLHAGLHMSLFSYMCWKEKMAMCKVIC